MDKPQYKQSTFYANKFEIQPVMNYLESNYGLASAGVFNIKEGGEVKIQSIEGKVEVMCNCDNKVVNDLMEIIEQNE